MVSAGDHAPQEHAPQEGIAHPDSSHAGSHTNAALGGGAEGLADLAKGVGSNGVDTGSNDGESFKTPPRTTRRGCRSPSPMSPSFDITTAETIPAADTEVEKVVGVRPRARPVPTPVRAADPPVDPQGPLLVDDPYCPSLASPLKLGATPKNADSKEA